MDSKKAITSIIFLCFGITGVFLEQVISASGGNFSSSGGTASYAMGNNTLYSSYTGANGYTISQCVQHAYEISSILISYNCLECTVYPNPTNKHLTIRKQ